MKQETKEELQKNGSKKAEEYFLKAEYHKKQFYSRDPGRKILNFIKFVEYLSLTAQFDVKDADYYATDKSQQIVQLAQKDIYRMQFNPDLLLSGITHEIDKYKEAIIEDPGSQISNSKRRDLIKKTPFELALQTIVQSSARCNNHELKNAASIQVEKLLYKSPKTENFLQKLRKVLRLTPGNHARKVSCCNLALNPDPSIKS